jgi:hypothetical protein
MAFGAVAHMKIMSFSQASLRNHALPDDRGAG